MLIWPSHVPHAVEQGTANETEERIVVPFNIMIRGLIELCHGALGLDVDLRPAFAGVTNAIRLHVADRPCGSVLTIRRCRLFGYVGRYILAGGLRVVPIGRQKRYLGVSHPRLSRSILGRIGLNWTDLLLTAGAIPRGA